MNRPSLLACLTALVLVGCEGIGRPVVGLRPEPPAEPENACFQTRCADVWSGPRERWQPAAGIGVDSQRCEARRTLNLELTGSQGLESRDLRCTDVILTADGPFELDLRNVPLAGARLQVTAEAPGTILLSGAVHAVEFIVRGPVDLEMRGGALGSSRFVIEGDPAHRLGTLGLEGVIATELVVRAPHGAVRAYQSSLSQAEIDAVETTLELATTFMSTVRSRELSALDSELRETDVFADRLVAAAGRLEAVDVRRCGRVTLASVDVFRSHIAPCEEGILLEDVDVERCLFEADVAGTGQIRGSAFAGRRVALENSRVALTALCGVESFTLDGGALECPSCDRAPTEVCGLARTVEPFCPGFEAAPCEGRPRLPSQHPW